MSKINPPLLPFTKRNIQKVSKSIVKHLSPDLLPKKWIEENSTNPMFGHCHTASGCFYKIFGSENVHLHRGLDPNGIYHWWIVTNDDEIIDLTSSQYKSNTLKSIYKSGEKKGLLGFGYRKKVLTLLDRVKIDLDI
jgi:hypothetical protein